MAPRLSHVDYTVAWICPLELEQIAAVHMLDDPHEMLPQSPQDHNSYMLGSIGGHNVVIAGLTATGNVSAAAVATQMRNTFTGLRFALLVGIGGGVPKRTDKGFIRLGDLVISQPDGEHSGVVQYDRGKMEHGNHFVRTGSLAPPPRLLLGVARTFEIQRQLAREDPLQESLKRIDTSRARFRKYRFPGREEDRLYQASYKHENPTLDCVKCGCSSDMLVNRDHKDEEYEEEDEDEIRIHRGNIASGEVVMKDGLLRDRYAAEHKILCFEMEAAGVLDDFPCLVIRGISDYSDSHKTSRWQGYAAAVAASYARQLFFYLPKDAVALEPKIAAIEKIDQNVESLIQMTSEATLRERQQKIDAWLGAPDSSTNLKEALKKREEQTCFWLTERSEFQRWKATSRSFLGLYGIPGCGKTILSSVIVNLLKQSCERGHEAIVYFYFDFNEPKKRQMLGCVSALMSQLSWFQSDGSHSLNQLYTDNREGTEEPTLNDLLPTFNSMMKEFQVVYIVLDALDECEDKEDLLGFLIHVHESSSSRMVFTSRREGSIELSLREHLTDCIEIDASLVDSDIRVHIQNRIQSHFRLGKLPKEFQHKMEMALMEGAQGMFRWVSCQLTDLERCTSNYDVFETLRSLPKDLNSTYARILSRIDVESCNGALLILQWALYSARPLSFAEVAEIATIDFDKQNKLRRNPDRVLWPDSIFQVCSSLVTRQYSTYITDDGKYEQVEELRLAHHTVKEFLISSSLSRSLSYTFERAWSHRWIAKSCLVYLLETEIPSEMTKCFLKTYPLALYAAQYFADHYRLSTVEIVEEKCDDEDQSQNHDSNDLVAEREEACPIINYSKLFIRRVQESESRGGSLNRLCSTFYNSNSHLVGSLCLYHPDWPHLANYNDLSFDRIPEPPTPLYLASLCGLNSAIHMLLDQDRNSVHEPGGRYGSPLAAASYHGWTDVVKYLLTVYDGDTSGLNMIGGQLGTAISSAAASGHDHIITLLHNAGSSVAIEGGVYGFPLQAAAMNNHLSTVKLLLRLGANPNDRGGTFYTALHAAANRDAEDIATCLLHAGADPNISVGRYGTTVGMAASRNRMRVLRLLVDKAGARVNIPGGKYATPLQTAVAHGHLLAARFLLDRGADVNATGGFYGSVLNAAIQSERSTEEIRRLVMDFAR